VVNRGPHVNIKNRTVINIRIMVEIGVNKTRYLIRKYHIEPRSNVKNNVKCEEIWIGDVSNPFELNCVVDI
jgi:hypothetical protein